MYLTNHKRPSTIQIIKSKLLSCLLTVCLLMFGIAEANADIAVTGCVDEAGINDSYTQGFTANGRPSFTSFSSFIIWWTGSRWELRDPVSGTVYMYNEADTSHPPAGNCWTDVACGSSANFTGGSTVPDPNCGEVAEIPTLSEWGLIVLALLLMTFGVLYQLQPRFRKLYELD